MILISLRGKFQIGMVRELTKGSYKIKYHANGVDKGPIEIDFTPPFRCRACKFVTHQLWL